MATNDTTSHPEKKSKAKASVPDDVVEVVLRRLPSRSLARFRCVCRDWNDLISSDAFRERHLQLHVDKPRTPLKLVHAPLAQCHRHRDSRSAGELCWDCPRMFGARSCRGLVLFRRPCALTFSVCNPSTGGVLHLPPFEPWWSESSAGIGFHAPTQQYKVVHIAFGGLTNRFTRRKDCRVLTVGDPAGWRPAPSGELLRSTTEDLISSVEDSDPVFANGRLHWILSPTYLYEQPRAQGILSFTLGDESFSTVPSPPFALPDVAEYEYGSDHPYGGRICTHRSTDYRKELYSPAGTALAELDGRLCMMRDVRLRRGWDARALFEIWKLDDYESGSWSLDYRVELARGLMEEPLVNPWLVIPLSYLGDGGGGGSSVETRKLLVTTAAVEAYVYDPATKALQMVASTMEGDEKGGCQGPEYMMDRLRLVLYQESLVHVAGMEYDDDAIGSYSVLPVKDFLPAGSLW